MSDSRRPLIPAMSRGLRGRCPKCGDGKLFLRYLKVTPSCEACGHGLAEYPADDGPAYVTILLVGHLIVAPLLLFPFIWKASPWIVVPATVIPLALATLVALPFVKGAFIGLLYSTGVKRGDARFHTADAAE
ncbi:MAG: DUF983 domain-containing protein [Phenylobacterium sp.]|uniref:DUF983 domain-containing protein n=1 Tax=Phenylobacterium sp. TaxID=1871053 RepID=UPI002A36BA5C|nr:DUF983 domain-containing protein [Phenylobacterium sp.]MDX9998524.1 DUF983 domain-containing protein [Phenylobacterium sp.]